MLTPMGDGLKLIWWAIIRLVRSRVSLEAEILSLRHQLNVLDIATGEASDSEPTCAPATCCTNATLTIY